VFDAVRQLLAAEPRIAYALVFGSHARGSARSDSDLDVAIGGISPPFAVLELGDLIGRLEQVSGRSVDLTLLDEAPAGLAYRVFRDGEIVLERDPAAFADRKARAMLDYFDWKPIEDLFTRGGRGKVTSGR
jgi:predicted nucleotidyltransferase